MGKDGLHNAILSDTRSRSSKCCWTMARPGAGATRPDRSQQASSGKSGQSDGRDEDVVMCSRSSNAAASPSHLTCRPPDCCVRQARRRHGAFDRGAQTQGRERAAVGRRPAPRDVRRLGNAEGVRHLLDLGVDVDARFQEGDGYFDIAKTAWRFTSRWRATMRR